MGDLTALNADIAQLTTDVNTLIGLYNAASDQSGIDSAAAAVQSLDSAVQAIPGVVPPAPEPAAG